MATSGDAGRPRAARSDAQDEHASPDELFVHATLAAIVESSDDAIVSKNLDGIITSWNRGAERLLGYTSKEIIGQHISILAAPGREDEMPMILARIRRGERVDHYETVRKRRDGSLVEISLSVSPLLDATGLIVGASKIARDISERRQYEQEREIRLGELQHRIKNLLSMVAAIARRTTTTSDSAESYRDAFLGRLAALTTAHEAAFQSQDEADLAVLITRLLQPYILASRDLTAMIEPGPAVTVARQKIHPIAFILHELATNSIKYGALSKPDGRLQIGWQTQGVAPDRHLHLDWKERRGPIVTVPAARGFGMKLIEFAARVELGGAVDLTFEPEGLHARITMPLD